MCRIHPTESRRQSTETEVDESWTDTQSVLLTVWKKSSMSFQGTDGFSVFDSSGNLVFRVDNYSRESRCTAGALLLMDGAGRPLLNMKPKIMSMHGQWNVSEGEDSRGQKAIFSMRRRRMVQSRDEAVVFKCGSGGKKDGGRGSAEFRIDGCFRNRQCRIWNGRGGVVAEVSRKRANNSALLLSDDVFNLVIKPGNDFRLIMAFVVIMDRICRKA